MGIQLMQVVALTVLVIKPYIFFVLKVACKHVACKL